MVSKACRTRRSAIFKSDTNPGAQAGESDGNEGRNGGQGRGQSHEGQSGEGKGQGEGQSGEDRDGQQSKGQGLARASRELTPRS